MSDYRALSDSLHECADAAVKYLSSQLGLNKILIEHEIDKNIEFRPTLHAISPDKHIICVEVVQSLVAPDIKEFVLSSKNHSLPVKLYLAVQKGRFSSYEATALKFARENGISILEIDPPNHGSLITNPPVALSLGGLRAFRLESYPKKYREPLRQAIETFKNGNPAKGCSEVYDEIEQLTRRIGKKADTMGAIKNSPSVKWENDPWSNLLTILKDKIDATALGCPLLKSQLFSRLIGMTEYRNQTGHKPSSLSKRIERDRQLRTRFESAMDELLGLITASKTLGV